jgi:hypothetical protein
MKLVIMLIFVINLDENKLQMLIYKISNNVYFCYLVIMLIFVINKLNAIIKFL